MGKVQGIELVRCVQAEQLDDNLKIQLWAMRSGCDVVVIKNNDVFSTKFFQKKEEALNYFNELKQTKGENYEKEKIYSLG